MWYTNIDFMFVNFCNLFGGSGAQSGSLICALKDPKLKIHFAIKAVFTRQWFMETPSMRWVWDDRRRKPAEGEESMIFL